jgi:hypothetical protein
MKHEKHENLMIPLGGGKYLTVYAVQSGWQYQTGSSVAIMASVGPFGAGTVSGTLVFHVTQGEFARTQRYRLRFTGREVSLTAGLSPPVGGQGSSEQMPSFPQGQVYRLPRSGAPMPDSGAPFAATQEAGSPTGFEGPFMMASFDSGFVGGFSKSVMFLGAPKGAATSWTSQDFFQYKYVTFFDSTWLGTTVGGPGSVSKGLSLVVGEIGRPMLA